MTEGASRSSGSFENGEEVFIRVRLLGKGDGGGGVGATIAGIRPGLYALRVSILRDVWGNAQPGDNELRAPHRWEEKPLWTHCAHFRSP